MLTGTSPLAGFDPVPWAVVLAAACVGAAWDARVQRLPNALTLPLLALGLVYAGVATGAAGVLSALLASVTLALPFIVLWLFAKGGAGDAKMMAAVGAWLGASQGITVLVAVTLAGAVLGTVLAFSRGDGVRLVRDTARAASAALAVALGRLPAQHLAATMPAPRAGQRFPYGVAILSGIAACFPFAGALA